jgi:uncharacterized protein (TIGR03083 family)
MEIGWHLEALRIDGELLATAAERVDLDTLIPTCPRWAMRDLLSHVGDVHRWAAGHIAQGRTDPIGREELTELAGPLPDDADLVGWFRDGHAALVKTLEGADPETECWTFLPAPSPVAFWARRQAHETAIHRADAESPAGPATITAFPTGFAVDGVDELLLGFLGRGGDDIGTDAPRTLCLEATDQDVGWVVRIGTTGVQAGRGATAADCTVRGTASDLYLLAWNRRSPEGLEVQGDRSLLDVWRDTVQITWSRDRS